MAIMFSLSLLASNISIASCPFLAVPTPYLPSKGKNWLMKEFYVVVTSENWGKALGGEYTATITFTSEVVIAQ